MWERLQEVLNKFETDLGIPYFRQGSLVGQTPLPTTFLTFWNASTPEGSFYDDKANSATWTWTIYFYTTDPLNLYTLPNKFLQYAKSEGFILQGKANDIPSGEEGYFGRYLTLKFFENYNLGD